MRHSHARIYVAVLAFFALIGFLVWQNKLFSYSQVSNNHQYFLAIVIDDFGGADTRGVEAFMAIKEPITFAVMPNLPHSKEESQKGHEKGFEIILHQPMEPIKGKLSWLGPGAITSNMSGDEIKRTFENNLASVPYAKGFNNHMGSKITSSKEKVTPIMGVAKSKGLYVLDSKTTPNSQLTVVADSMHVPWVKRDVFLDDIKNKGEVHKQIEMAIKVAKLQGYAVAIGHVGRGGDITAEAVKEAIPLFKKEGVKLVPLSQIVHLTQKKD